MDLFNENGSRLRRFIGGHSSVPSTIRPAAYLIMTCLAVFTIFLSFACNGPMPAETPIPHMRTFMPTSTCTPSPTVSPTPTLTLFPPVTLTEPESGSVFDWGSEMTLHWSSLYTLQAGEYYRLRIQPKGQRSFLFYHNEDHFALPDLSPGEYEWAVAIVRSIGEDRHELVSDESDWHSFEIAPPKPVAHSISPESTVQGHSVQVVVSGENFIPSLAIIIGIPLQTTFLNSGTITATIPITLAAGQYPVIVQDPTGGTSISSTISFTVHALTRPTAMRPPYPPPVLGWGGIIRCNVTFRWKWAGTLAEDEWFEVRVGEEPNPPRAQTWTHEFQYTYALTEAGEYAWQIAICRGKPEDARCSSLDGTELVASEYGFFEFGGCETKPPHESTLTPP